MTPTSGGSLSATSNCKNNWPVLPIPCRPRRQKQNLGGRRKQSRQRMLHASISAAKLQRIPGVDLTRTLTPFEGVVVPVYYSESKEAVRQAVHKWIRTSGAFDGVIDFDAVLRDPEHLSRLLPRSHLKIGFTPTMPGMKPCDRS